MSNMEGLPEVDNLIELWPENVPGKKVRLRDETGNPLDRFGLLALLLAGENANAQSAEELRELNELMLAQRADMLGGVDDSVNPQEVLLSPNALRRRQRALQEGYGDELFNPNSGIWIF